MLPSVTEVHEVTRLDWGQASNPMMHFTVVSSRSRKHVRPSMSSNYVYSVLANGSGWRLQENYKNILVSISVLASGAALRVGGTMSALFLDYILIWDSEL